jgi:sugar-specific transcriptional regulator TrmB
MQTELLKQFGLTGGEADLYSFLLENGDSPVSEIASQTTIGRTNIYEYAKCLKEKGLLTDFERKRKIYYHAESPLGLEKVVLESIAKSQGLRSTYNDLIPRLQEMYLRNSNLTQVKYHLGDEGYRYLCNRIYLEGADNELILMLKDINEYEPPEPRYRSFIQNRQLITYLYTCQKDNVSEFQKRDEREMRHTIYIPNKIREDMIIYEDLCIIGSFSKSNFKMAIIENMALAHLLRSLLLPSE